MIRLALLRHGHTAWNRAHRIQGRTDIPLDAEGIATLAALRLPPPWDKADLVASPLARAQQTATLVTGRQATPVPALIEMDWGDWEGQRGVDLDADPACDYRPICDWGWDWSPPGGEAPAALRARLAPWLASLQRDTVAVCHIGTMRVLMALATGWHFDGPAPFAIKRARLYVIEVDAGTLRAWPDPVRLVEAI